MRECQQLYESLEGEVRSQAVCDDPMLIRDLVASSSFDDSVLTHATVAVLTVTDFPASTAIDFFWKGTSARESSVRPSISTTPYSTTTVVATLHTTLTDEVMKPLRSDGEFDFTLHEPLLSVRLLSACAVGAKKPMLSATADRATRRTTPVAIPQLYPRW